MKLIDNILYLEFAEVLECGISLDTLKKASSRNSPSWEFIDDPADKRKRLIKYEALKPTYKLLIENKYGNPYNALVKQPIRAMVVKDLVAERFYMDYTNEDGESIPEPSRIKFTTAASWLNMLAKMDNKTIKSTLNISIAQFYIHIAEIIRQDNLPLPEAYVKLLAKRKEYAESGYECLIDRRLWNKNAAKVDNEVSESLLIEMMSQYNQHDDTIICRYYNEAIVARGGKPITARTISNWRRKHDYEIKMFSEGVSVWQDIYGKVIHRKRPSAPMLLVGSDDNDLDLYFHEERIDKNNHLQQNYYFRYKLMVVMDAHNDYILGYSYGDGPSTDLIRAAYLDAMYHIRELTCGWYLPHQIQTDRWGNGTLDEWYKQLAIYTPATAKLARAKYIERAFGQEWHQSLKMYPNYSGHNITSGSRINTDALLVNKKLFPMKDAAHLQIADHIGRMRLLPNKTGKTRQQVWLDNFCESDLSAERRISEKQMLMLFGTTHGYPNTITNDGLIVTIDKRQYIYDIPDELYLPNVGKKVQVIYEPLNLGRVLVTDGKNLHFIAKEFGKVASALKDYAPGERSRLNYELERKTKHVKTIGEQKKARQQILDRNRIDAESILQAGIVVKEVKQAAETVYLPSTIDRDNFNPFEQM